MNYVLTYSCAGHQMTYGPTDLADINRTIRSLYDENDEIAILSVQEFHDDAPRTWTRPDAPVDVNRVLGEDTGQIWTRKDARARTRSMWTNGNYSLSWVELLDHEKTLTAVVETELEGAARRLREKGYSHSVAAEEDIRIVLDHVLGGGTL